jgi:peptidoglycan/xylan/chitin deacetylase (PgdA/CDA1 family)
MSTCAKSAVRRSGSTTARPARANLLQRAAIKSSCQCAECAKGKGVLQRAAVTAHAPADVPPIVYDVLRSPGEPLERGTREFMEERFGHDFSAVRVHTDARAAESARAVNARAYTVGSHIAFGRGEYRLGTDSGKSLLTHELIHTLQQSLIDVMSSKSLFVMPADDAREIEAKEIARASGVHDLVATFAIRTGTGLLLQRSEDKETDPQRSPVGRVRTFSLTFDDGPNQYTKIVLDTLKQKGIKAVFFIQTAAVDELGHPYRGSTDLGKALIKRMHDEGHMIEIHTGGKVEHEAHAKAARKGRLKSELGSAKHFVEGLTKATPTLVRPPFGEPFETGSQKDRELVAEIYQSVNLKNLLWDIDGDNKDRRAITSAVDLRLHIANEVRMMHKKNWKTKTISPNVVVLYHDSRSATANALAQLIEQIQACTKDASGGKDTAEFKLP